MSSSSANQQQVAPGAEGVDGTPLVGETAVDRADAAASSPPLLPAPTLEEYLLLSPTERDALALRVSKSALKKLKKRASAAANRMVQADARRDGEAQAVALGAAQRAAAGLAPDGPASAAIAAVVAAAEAAARVRVMLWHYCEGGRVVPLLIS
jgi:hypothetical protein